MKAGEVITMIKNHGWYLKTQKGSHMQFVHDTKPGKITIPFHGKKDIPIGTLKAILKQAGVK